MARPLRIEYPHAFYHLIARGQRRDVIFYADDDRQEFLERLKETVGKYKLRVHAYVLMNNHYHLLLETPLGNLSTAMHFFHASYTNWFRTKHRLVGSIFQGRFKSILVEKDAYLLELSAYIHLNPVRAGISERPEEYVWSSFGGYCARNNQDFPYTREVREAAGGRKLYREFVINRIRVTVEKEEVYGKNGLLGGEGFKNKVLSWTKERFPAGVEREVGELRRLRQLQAEEVKEPIVERFGIEEGKLVEKRRGNIYRKLYLYGLKQYTGLSLKEIGELSGMDYAAVSGLVRQFRKESKTKREMERVVDLLDKALRATVKFKIET